MAYTIELTDDELRLLHAALHAYLDDFGHDEVDVLRRVKALIASCLRLTRTAADAERRRLRARGSPPFL
jgi:hypothetical protein